MEKKQKEEQEAEENKRRAEELFKKVTKRNYFTYSNIL